MKQTFKIITFQLFTLIFLNKFQAQDIPTGKGSSMLSLSGSFTQKNTTENKSVSGGYYTDQYSVSNLFISSTYNYFVVKNVFIGPGMELVVNSNTNSQTNSIGFGSQFGFAFTVNENKLIPFLSLGGRYYVLLDETSYNYEFKKVNHNATKLFVNSGIIVPIKKHIGLTIYGEYYKYATSNDRTDHVFAINLGITGLLYRIGVED